VVFVTVFMAEHWYNLSWSFSQFPLVLTQESCYIERDSYVPSSSYAQCFLLPNLLFSQIAWHTSNGGLSGPWCTFWSAWGNTLTKFTHYAFFQQKKRKVYCASELTAWTQGAAFTCIVLGCFIFPFSFNLSVNISMNLLAQRCLTMKECNPNVRHVQGHPLQNN
jgi:hypothetical protein